MIIKCLVVFSLVLLRGIFAAMDTALAYVDKYKIAKLIKKDKKAEEIKFLIDDRIKFWGVIEIGIIVAELFLTAYAAEAFTNIMTYKIENFGIEHNIATLLAVIVITIILTYILLIFGTVLPKQMARNNPEKVAYRCINILWIFSKLNYPFEWLIRQTTEVFCMLFGIERNPESKLTENQIKMIIEEGKEQGALENLEKKIAIKALKFDDIKIKSIMIKKENINFLNINESNEAILDHIEEHKFTRNPVYRNNPDTKENILGIFNIKDLIVSYAKDNNINMDIKKYLRPIEFVNKEEPVSTVFKKMQKDKIYMAIVLDKNNKVCGIVTMEDILEMLVGKIFDEFEKVK